MLTFNFVVRPLANVLLEDIPNSRRGVASRSNIGAPYIRSKVHEFWMLINQMSSTLAVGTGFKVQAEDRQKQLYHGQEFLVVFRRRRSR